MEKEQFVAVRRNSDGDLIAFKSNTGKGTYIRGIVDGDKDNNLSNLPTF